MANDTVALTVPQLADLGRKLRETGKEIVFTNGCFDILHPGHVQLLTQAKALGDVLVVGINSDASVKRLKGLSRPIHTQHDRAYVLAALKAVDYVVIFDEPTPVECIQLLRPNIHVKGGDYRQEDLPETAVVEAYGGRVTIVPFRPGHSTSKILAR